MDRFDQLRPGPGFRDLDLPLQSAPDLSVRLVVPGDLFLVACPPTTMRPLESSAGSSLGSPRSRESIGIRTGRVYSRGRSVASRRHTPRSCLFGDFPLPRRRSPTFFARPSSRRKQRLLPPGASACTLSLRRHLGGGRGRFTPLVLLACDAVDVVSRGATSISR